uniref:collagen alpha-6(VI) chain-like isoform X2 n=1 Tax=Ciona intestinalis TaxID=7719 RepID=UPI00089DD585|nr:collagen alpha-6(VI) chain-like isoform X2 [Ciona intestinalis]|eukprot:XP_018671382.1 collagen alpha-6(VI) chain-like isoform X2 [Ciona intestinalis]
MRILGVIVFVVFLFFGGNAQLIDGVPGCRTTKLELVFLVDGSSSVSREDFLLVKQWVHNMTLNFDISRDTTRVAVVQYSSYPRTEFDLDTYSSAVGVLRGIDLIQYMSGNTQTGLALRYAIESVFSRAREDSAKVAIVLSDGRSQDQVNEAATSLRSSGIATFAVGIGDEMSHERMEELRQISVAAAEDQSSVFMAKDFRSIGQLQERLVSAVCEQTVQECPTSKHDLAFVIDASSTIGYNDFMKVKAWIKKIVKAFDVGPEETRVAVVQYSTSVQEEFNFGHLLSKQQVLDAIDNMDYIMGDTHTGAALTYMLDEIYSSANGDRPDVPDLAIVMTDGKAQEPDLVVEAANRVHEAGVTVYTVGVADYSLEEIKVIASDPDKNYVIEALNFDIIELKRRGLIKSICTDAEQTCPAATAELVFLIDGSTSIGFDNFEKLKRWLKSIVDAFQVGPHYTRVAVVQFTNRPVLEFGLNDHSTTQATLQAIQRIRYRRGSTSTGRAIEFVMNEVFTHSRENVPKILIALTDGQSQDDVTQATASAAEAGVHTLVFGIGNTRPGQLRQLVSKEDHVFQAAGFDVIQKMQSKLVSLICVKAEPECSSQEIDLHFMVDGSGSIGNENFRKVKAWIKNVVRSFDVGKYTTRVALTQYTSTINTEFDFKKFSTKREIDYAIDQMEFAGGATLTAQALVHIRENGFTEESGARPGAPKVLVVISDGRSADNIETPARKLHESGVYVFAIGVGNTWRSALEIIGSEPVVTHVQEGASYDAINNFRRDLVRNICRETKPECAETEMDLIFLIDGSNSIGPREFETTKEWIGSFVREFEIGEYNTKIGVVQYSSRVRSEIDIGDYDSKADLLAAISSIEFAAGNTNTGSALEYVRTVGFSGRHGARNGVPKVLIVLTDGNAQDGVLDAASKLHRDGVAVYAIGVGRPNMGQLNAVTSEPITSPNIYHVRNFDAIQTIQSGLLRRVCNKVVPDCARTATDLMFLVDGSTSVGHESWGIIKSFMQNMTQKFQIGPDAVRVGMIQYSTRPKTNIAIGQYNDKESLQEAFGQVEWQLGDTYTARALRYVSKSYARATTRENLHATKLLIIITDGQPQDRNEVKQAVRNLHSEGWRIFAIGVGQSDISELGILASNPDSDHVFYANNFNSTRIFQGRLSRLICGDPSFESKPNRNENQNSQNPSRTPDSSTNRNRNSRIPSGIPGSNSNRNQNGPNQSRNNQNQRTNAGISHTNTGSTRNGGNNIGDRTRLANVQNSLSTLLSSGQQSNQPNAPAPLIARPDGHNRISLRSPKIRRNNRRSDSNLFIPSLGPVAATLRTPPGVIVTGSASTCPSMRRDGKKSNGVDVLDGMGLSRIPSSSRRSRRRHGTHSTAQVVRIRKGQVPPKPMQSLLPNGLPLEFSLIAIFRMHGRTIKDTWSLLHVADSTHNIMFSLSFNGINRSLFVSRYSFASRTRLQTVALSGPLVASLFDRSFHKLELLVEQNKITVMIDCQQAPTAMRFNSTMPNLEDTKISILGSGKTTSTVDVQDLTLKCGDNDAEECCEMDGLKCSRVQANRISTRDTCGCLPERKSAEVRAAEEAEITRLATKIANQIVEAKINNLMVLLDINPGAIGRGGGDAMVQLSRRAASTPAPGA